MKSFFAQLNIGLKNFILFLQPHVLFGFLKKPFLFCSNVLHLTEWIATTNKTNSYNDFFSLKRNYNKRYNLYEHVGSAYQLKNTAIDYLEFGVSDGHSFAWWTKYNEHPDSKFYGFDTFEGLPENWGALYKKGDMQANIPIPKTKREMFLKGLFQETLPAFLQAQYLHHTKRKVIHLDADLFSSTLFTLSSLAYLLKPGDILLFDEFNVPNHEFYAFSSFVNSFYIEMQVIGAVNNYLQTAFIVVRTPFNP
jgi:hypothetical protein